MLRTKPSKPAKCKHCKERTDSPYRLLHDECIPAHLEALRAKQARAAEKKRLAEAKVDKARRAKLRTNGQRKAAAQAAVNAWVVHVRDADQPCISCKRMHVGAWHAGHYRSRGSAPHLALDPRNLARQCAPCNLYLHGNLIEYRKGLISRHGLEFVEALEADQEPRHYTGDDYDAIAAEYRSKRRQLEKEIAG